MYPVSCCWAYTFTTPIPLFHEYMWEEILKVLSILLLTMLKFIAGPTLGYAGGFSLISTILITIAGMMASVVIFTFLGEVLKEKVLSRFFVSRKRFTKRNRQFVKIWNRYGIVGVTMLTPVIFTPIGGTLLLTAFGSPKNKILIWMFIWAVFWAIFFSSVIFYFGDVVLKYFSL